LKQSSKNKFTKTKFVHPQTKKERYVSKKMSKKLSGQLKKKIGLNIVKQKGKKYDAYLEDHERWVTYCKNLLGLDYLETLNWTGDPTDSRTINTQNKFKKVEFYGSRLEIVQSKCPGMVGISGIVIKDTKTTLVIICEDNKVKTIPKCENEFKFIVENTSFTILGKHIHQRPIERSKHVFKKHNLQL